jgi:hypothetical protein
MGHGSTPSAEFSLFSRECIRVTGKQRESQKVTQFERNTRRDEHLWHAKEEAVVSAIICAASGSRSHDR